MHVQDRVTFFESSLRLRLFDTLMINTSLLIRHLPAISHFAIGDGNATNG
jgi:hypothetical protein